MNHVHLINPKTPANVGGVLRACSIFGVEGVTWTGGRVHDALHRYTGTTFGKKTKRLPREERMRQYKIDWGRDDDGLQKAIDNGLKPICVEVDPLAVPLPWYRHPEEAVYVFGPEDGSIPKGIRTACHDFITIPSKSCLNLAAAVNVVLYDRIFKQITAGEIHPRTLERVVLEELA